MGDFRSLVELSDDENDENAPETALNDGVLTSIGRKLANKLKRPRSRGSSARSSAKSTPMATPTHSAPASPLKKAFRDDVFDFDEDHIDPSCTKATADGDSSSSKFPVGCEALIE